MTLKDLKSALKLYLYYRQLIVLQWGKHHRCNKMVVIK